MIGGILLLLLEETIRLKNTGFVGKTLWDWMELLVIPLVLAIGAFYLERSERAVDCKTAEDRAKLERELATDRQQEAALQAYLDRMAELLLKEKQGESEDERVLKVKRVRTLTVMRGLNAARNRIVLRFLRDVGLVGNQESTLIMYASLEGTDLEGIDIGLTNLQGANLKGSNPQGAILESANLESVNLEGANLQEAFLRGANLQDAFLRDTNLEGASLTNTTMPDGTFHD